MSDTDDTICWQALSKEQLFAMAKWNEARAEAFKEIIEMLTTEPEPVKYSITMPSLETKTDTQEDTK